MYQISRLPRHLGGQTIEQEHKVVKLLKWLPAGPLPDGSVREKSLVQFIARQGGIRTVNVDDLTFL